jgi:cyanophycinase-like exopeptidase
MRQAKLVANGFEYEVSLPFGVLIKAVSNGNVSVWAESENGEVMSVSDGSITVQGTGEVSFVVAQNGKQTKQTVSFKDEAVKTIII